MDISDQLHRRLRLAAVAVVALGAPVAYSPGHGLQFNSACAASLDGSCCARAAICGLNGQNYVGFQYQSGGCPKT